MALPTFDDVAPAPTAAQPQKAGGLPMFADMAPAPAPAPAKATVPAAKTPSAADNLPKGEMMINSPHGAQALFDARWQAMFVGVGGGMTSTSRGIGEMYSHYIGDGTYAKQVQNEQFELKRLQDDPYVGGYAKGGDVVGTVADPVTAPLMAMKAGKTVLSLVKLGAKIGAVAGVASPQQEESLLHRAESALMGAAGGAAFMGVLGVGINGYRALLGRELIPFTEKEVKDIGNDIKALVPHAKDETITTVIRATQPITPPDHPAVPPDKANGPVGRTVARAKEYWARRNETKRLSGDVEQQIHSMQQQKNLDTTDMHDMVKSLHGMGLSAEQTGNVIQHIETLGEHPLSPEEQKYFDALKPTLESMGWTDGYFPRRAQGKAKEFGDVEPDAADESGKSYVSAGKALRTGSELDKTRRWVKLVDEDGVEHVAYREKVDGGYRFSLYKDKAKVGSVNVKSVTNGEAANRATAVVDARLKKINAEVKVLEPRQGVVSKSYRELKRVSAKLRDLTGSDADIASTVKDTQKQLAAIDKERDVLGKVKNRTDKDTARLNELNQQRADLEDLNKTLTPDADAILGGAKPEEQDAAARREISKGSTYVKNRIKTLDARVADLTTQASEAGMSRQKADGILRQVEALKAQKRALEKTAEIYNPGEKRLATLKAARDKLTQQRADIMEGFGDHDADIKQLRDKDNKTWQVKDATVKDVEQHTNTAYHKDAAAILARQYINEQAAARHQAFIDSTKESMVNNGIGIRSGDVPEGWKTTKLPNFAGWKMEPRLANVLDALHTQMEGGPGRLPGWLYPISKANDLYREVMFSIPGWHDFNIMLIGATEKGLFSTVHGLVRGVSFGAQANGEVANLGPVYRELYAKGYPFKYADMITNDTRAKAVNSMATELEHSDVGDEAARHLGYKSGKALAERLRTFQKNQEHRLWMHQDAVTMTRIMEKMDKGMTAEQAADETFKTMPTYRLSTQSAVNNMLRHPDVTWFLPYHRDLFRAYGNMARDVVKGTTEQKMAALDRIAMQAVISMVMFPALDKAVQKGAKLAHVAGAEGMHVFRFGLAQPLSEAYDMVTGKRSVSQELQSYFSIAPGIKEAAQQFLNRDFFRGSHLSDDPKKDELTGKPIHHGAFTKEGVKDNAHAVLQRVEHALMQSLPIQATVEHGWLRALLEQEGILSPTTDAEKQAAKLKKL